MPIYAYRCPDCGFERDVLQKFSDAPLTVCPSCGGSSFAKQLTAPAFQLKGSGWYATDFRDGGGKKAPDALAESHDKPADASGDQSSASPSDKSGASADKPGASEPAASKPASAGSGEGAPLGASSAKTASGAATPSRTPVTGSQAPASSS